MFGMLGSVSDRLFKCSQLLREDELRMSNTAMVHVSCYTLSILCLILGNTPRHHKSSRNVQLSQAQSI
jgi:hypothetical protein